MTIWRPTDAYKAGHVSVSFDVVDILHLPLLYDGQPWARGLRQGVYHDDQTSRLVLEYDIWCIEGLLTQWCCGCEEVARTSRL